MALRHHFIIAIENGKLMVEPDSSDGMFADYRTILNTKTQEWLLRDEMDDETEEAFELVASIAEMHNDPRL